MSSLDNYTDLQSGIATWLLRSGDTKISTNAADIVLLAEERIAYGDDDPEFPSLALRIRPMETPVDLVMSAPITGATVGGTANAITLTSISPITSYSNGLLYQFSPTANNTGAVTVNIDGQGSTSLVIGSARSALSGNELVKGGTFNIYYDAINTVFVLLPQLAHCPLPKNYLAMREFSYLYPSNYPKPLRYVTPQQLNEMYLNTVPGPPEVYTIEGDAIRFAPIPDTTYYAPCIYFQKFTPLVSATSGTNWLLTNAPRVYLYGCLLEAAILVKSAAWAPMYLRRYVGACNALQGQDERDRHSGSPLSIRNMTGNP